MTAVLSATDIIADTIDEHDWDITNPFIRQCVCGAKPVSLSAHRAEQAVERLGAAGHTIVPSGNVTRVYRAASTLGQQYMMPTYFSADLEEAERWFALQQKMLGGLPGVETVRLEYRDELDSDWQPLAAAASATTKAGE